MIAQRAESQQTESRLRYLKKQEAADIFGVSYRTITEWVAHQGFPHIKVGNTIRFERESIDNWAQNRLQGDK